MGTTINLQELCALVGVERLTILRWTKKGLPHTREKGKRGGRPQLVFDKEAALSWVAANGSMTAGRKAAAISSQPFAEQPEAAAPAEPVSSPSPPSSSDTPTTTTRKRTPATIDMDVVREPGLLGNLERLKAQEVATSTALLRAKQANDIQAIVALSDRHIQETKTLASLEQIALTYKTKLGELGPRQQMQSVYEKVIIGIKNSVLGIPSTAVAQLLPFLRSPDDAYQVRAILDKVTRDSLRSIGERTTRHA